MKITEDTENFLLKTLMLYSAFYKVYSIHNSHYDLIMFYGVQMCIMQCEAEESLHNIKLFGLCTYNTSECIWIARAHLYYVYSILYSGQEKR